MRKAGVVPLTAAVTTGSPLLRSIAGEPAARVTLPAALVAGNRRNRLHRPLVS